MELRPGRACAECGRMLRVRKTVNRRVMTPAGARRVRERVCACPVHRKLVRHEPRLTPYGSGYTFGLIAEIGKLRYLQHRQISEICRTMKGQGVRIPARTADWLCRLFLRYFAAVHIESAPAIRELLERQGGYVLILDGTGHHGPMVMQMRDGWSGIQLLSGSVRLESDDEIVPYLKMLNGLFGRPVAAVRDMGSGETSALKQVFPGMYVITCHFHFLRAAGWKLFEPIYPNFRSKIERTGLKKRMRHLMRVIASGLYTGKEAAHALELCRWIFKYRKDGTGMGYPFSLPALDFYMRCEKVRRELLETVDMGGPRRGKTLRRLLVLLNRLHPPPATLRSIDRDAKALIERVEWFDRIRRVLRYRNGPVPLSTKHKLSETAVEKGRRRLNWLRSVIAIELKSGGDARSRELHRTLRSIGGDLADRMDELFAPNVVVQTEDGPAVRPLPRTISGAETDFRHLRRHSRRITGNAHVDDQVQNEGPGMLLLENLRNSTYVGEVYGSISNLPKRFSTVSQKSLEDAKKILQCAGTNE